MMIEEYLPIGTIVLLNGGEKKVMITGFCAIDNENKHKLYDYSGCLYPEGIINSNEICLFNQNQIKEIYFKGYISKEEKIFKEHLVETIKKVQLDIDHNIIDEEVTSTPDIAEVQTFKINDSIFN